MTPKVLIVDDNANNRLVLTDALEGEGYSMREAVDGVEALRLVHEDPPDLVLLDVMMPRMNGIECCRRLKSSTAHAHIPVILVTALADDEHVIEGLNEGASDYVAKPFTGAVVRARVRAALRSKQAHDELEESSREVRRLADELEAKNRSLAHLALHDSLTGLPNRALLQDRLNQAIRRMARDRECHFALLFLDFDGFKLVNDSFGHEAGDELLVSIAERLQTELRGMDTLCRGDRAVPSRLGGDEFVVLLDDLADPTDAARVVDRLQQALNRPHAISGRSVAITASVGVALSHSRYREADEMLHDADSAMYKAKRAGRACVVVFDDAMHEQTIERLRLESALREAVQAEDLAVRYQPVVRLDDGRVVGFESSCHWRHPELGWIPSKRLAATAEATGLAGAIGGIVMRRAIAQLAAWSGGLSEGAPAWLGVKLWTPQLEDGELLRTTREALEDTGVCPSRVILEIPEMLLADRLDELRDRLEEFRGLGVRLAVDGCGKGHSALTRLHRAPVNMLKIDPSPIGSLGRHFEFSAIVQAMIQLAHNLGLQVVAAGVENLDQVALLQALECDCAQGALFGKPMNGDAAESLGRKLSRRPA